MAAGNGICYSGEEKKWQTKEKIFVWNRMTKALQPWLSGKNHIIHNNWGSGLLSKVEAN